jgi:hypothetical protein
VRGAVPVFTVQALGQDRHIGCIAHPHAALDLRFDLRPIRVFVNACGLSLSMGAHFKINFFGLHPADQPETAQAKAGQHQTRHER